MIPLSTKFKIKCASLISDFLVIFLGDKNRIINRNNINYNINLREGIDLSIFLGIQNENSISNINKITNINDKKIIIDIGANIGSVSLPLAKIFRNSRIISIEPTIYAFSRLRKNVSLNPNLKKRIKLLNICISNKKMEIKEVHSSWNFLNNGKKHKVHLGTLKKTSLKMKKLDQICSKFKNVNLIKIDVDGHELDVLKSGKKTIMKHKPFIYFEFAPYLYREFGYSSEILIKFVKNNLNYIFYDEKLTKVSNISDFVKKLHNRSQNFFLLHKDMRVK
tara:strand:- start:355 stop:1188 length:834 start_codon:yes stop_codon:yes gene_type:complete